MKTSLLSTNRVFGAAILAAVALVAVSPSAYAKDKDKDKDRGKPSQSSGRGFDPRGNNSRHNDHRHNEDDRRRFFAQSRSSFCLTLGDGYAGRGYYYGPPNANYYYQGGGILFYNSREQVPTHYRGYPVQIGTNRQVTVQRNLARIGYYRGPIDGYFGPITRDAIARFQRDHRLKVTGGITQELMRKLALD